MKKIIVTILLAALLCAMLCTSVFASPLESAWLPRIEGKHTLADDAQIVNPHYREEGWWGNCTHCAISYELRRRGFDVVATPASQYGDAGKLSYFETFFQQYTQPSCVKNFVSEAEADCIKAGCGARFLVIIPVNGSAEQTHTLVLENVDGEAIWVDPQQGGQVVPVRPNDTRYVNWRLCDYYWARIDTQDISAEAACLYCKEAEHE